MPTIEPEAVARPQPSLETERLILRLPEPDDASVLTEQANDAAVVRYTATLPFPYTFEDAKGWIELSRTSAAKGRDWPYVIVPRDAGAPIGAIGLHARGDAGEGLVGFWIGQAYWNLGYASEALAAVLRHGFETAGFEQIAASVFPENAASLRVMARAGFVEVGRGPEPTPARDQAEHIVARFVLERASFTDTGTDAR